MRDYGADYVELAYSSSGTYLGYGWKRGTLEYFLNRQAQDLEEEIQIVYTNRHLENNSMVDDIFGAERYDKKGRLYGFNRDENIVDITQKDELDFSIYAFEAGTNQPVNVFYDGAGVRTFQKILTTRIATIHADTSQEYTTGTYTGSSF